MDHSLVLRFIPHRPRRCEWALHRCDRARGFQTLGMGAFASRDPCSQPLLPLSSLRKQMAQRAGAGQCLMTATFMRLCLVQETRCKFVLPFHSYYIADPSFSIMPPGLPHAVFSVSLQGYRPTSVLMSGSHFISEHSLPAMLEASISHSLWHDIWTNALHDDKIAHMAWMLDDFLRRTRAQHSSHRQESGGALGGVQAFA